jgi:hypothetical protein
MHRTLLVSGRRWTISLGVICIKRFRKARNDNQNAGLTEFDEMAESLFLCLRGTSDQEPQIRESIFTWASPASSGSMPASHSSRRSGLQFK